MRFHVIGVGSIGSLLSYHLRRALSPQHRISLIVRRVNNYTEPPTNTPKRITIECNGLKASLDGFDVEYADPLVQDVYDLLRQKQQANMQRKQDIADAAAAISQDQAPSWIRRAIHSSPLDDRPRPAQIDSLFVATKATAVVRAIEECKNRLHSGTTIVLLQNGMGIYEAVVDRLFPNPESRPNFIIASTTHGAWKKTENTITHHVVHAGIGELQFGIVADARMHPRDYEHSFWEPPPPPKDSTTIAPPAQLSLDDIESRAETDNPFSRSPYRTLRATIAALQSLSDLNASWVPMAEMQIVLRQKLVVNSCINPITALLDCRNGELLNSRHAHALIRAVCREAGHVYRSLTTEDDFKFGTRTTHGGLDRLSGASLEDEVHRVARKTSANYSSMLVDMREGALLEVDYMNGYLRQLGKQYKVPTPTIDALKNMVVLKASMRTNMRAV
jgi:2-dehydropantoate 2-reductase